MPQQTTKEEVRNLTNIEDIEALSDSELDQLIQIAVEKTENEAGDIDITIVRRLQLLYSAHLVKLKMRGAGAISDISDITLEELDEESTIYKRMYDQELNKSANVYFSHVG